MVDKFERAQLVSGAKTNVKSVEAKSHNQNQKGSAGPFSGTRQNPANKGIRI